LRADALRSFGVGDFLIACREFFERDLVNGFLVKGLAMCAKELVVPKS
jgi:hypothetical protein